MFSIRLAALAELAHCLPCDLLNYQPLVRLILRHSRQVNGRQRDALPHLLRHLLGRLSTTTEEAEEPPQRRASAEQLGPGLVVHNTLVILDVALDDPAAQICFLSRWVFFYGGPRSSPGLRA